MTPPVDIPVCVEEISEDPLLEEELRLPINICSGRDGSNDGKEEEENLSEISTVP